MAKISSIQKNKNRGTLVDRLRKKRDLMKAKIYDKNLPLDERFQLIVSLSALPRNSSRIRLRNRCELTGRSRGYFRKFSLSRNMLRELGSKGLIPGLIKASW